MKKNERNKNNPDKWDSIISSENNFFNINLRELFKYYELIYFFAKRDFVIFYKQTILGPIWYLLQPLIYTLVFTIIFGKVAKISTDEIPPFLFYFSGNVMWGFFASSLVLISNTFITNKNIFGKVYFPRLVIPISNLSIGLTQFCIQFLFFMCFVIYYNFYIYDINFSLKYFLIPLLVIQISLISIGFGILLSSLTTKYRDLTFAMSFLVQLWMFATPIVYPVSIIPDRFIFLAMLNPMTSVVETFRWIIFQTPIIDLKYIFLSLIITVIFLLLGALMFNRMEKTFMDTI